MILNSKIRSTILILGLSNDLKSVAWTAPQDQERKLNVLTVPRGLYRDQEMLG